MGVRHGGRGDIGELTSHEHILSRLGGSSRGPPWLFAVETLHNFCTRRLRFPEYLPGFGSFRRSIPFGPHWEPSQNMTPLLYGGWWRFSGGTIGPNRTTPSEKNSRVPG